MTISYGRMLKFLERVPELYGMGGLVSYDDQTHGYANTNFRIKTTVGSAFVRFCEEQAKANVEQEILLMSLMKERSIRAAYPLKSISGDYILYLDDLPVVVYELASGGVPQPSPRVAAEIGLEVGRISSLGVPESLVKKNSISPAGASSLAAGGFNPAVPADIARNFSELFAQIAHIFTRELPQGVVHGDIFPDNTLFDGERLVAIVDFEEFAVDTLLFDVGMAVNGFCFNEGELIEEYYTSLLASYNSSRELTKDERDLLPDYVAWSAIGMTAWHLNHLTPSRRGEQTARMRELLNRAEMMINRREKILSIPV